VEITYKNNKLEQKLNTDKGLAKSYGTLAKKVKQRMTQIKSAINLQIIADNKVLRLHPYKGDRKGEWSIDIQENWRICFVINQDPIPVLEDGGVFLSEVSEIKIISVEDPH
jgi:proteic killer suppression protein